MQCKQAVYNKMEQKERWEDIQNGVKEGLNRALSRLWTALPVIVAEDSSDGHTVSLQPAINGTHYNAQDGSYKSINMPQLKDVPIHFPQAGGLVHTFPVKKGDEGIVVFSARCIDGWWQNGAGKDSQGNVTGQDQMEARRHNLSDAMFIPGIRSNPRKLSNISTNSSQIRLDDGSAYVELMLDGTINFKPKTNVYILSGNLYINQGAVYAQQNVTAGYGTGDQVELQQHIHTAVQSGAGFSGPPKAGS
jgi:hypothetical protein